MIINSLQWVADTFESEKFEDFAELGRIGKYYAVEDMLTTKSEEKFGTTITLQEYYDQYYYCLFPASTTNIVTIHHTTTRK